MKQFTESDVKDERIYADREDLVWEPPSWMWDGRQQTASGYGKKLNSGYWIHFAGKLYRIYTTIYSNNGTSWFTVYGRKIIVS